MRVLLIAFQAYDNNMYPPLECFIDLLSERVDFTYFHLQERGYTFEMIQQRPLMVLRTPEYYRRGVRFLGDYRLLRRLSQDSSFDVVIAVDHFAFYIASRFFPADKLVFWSHDIISHDKPLARFKPIQMALQGNRRALQQGSRLIIQDPARLDLLEKSLGITIDRRQVFLMPIFLRSLDIPRRLALPRALPTLMQYGGIGHSRFSTDLLEHFQTRADRYRLAFHGVFFSDFRTQLDRCEHIPWMSSVPVQGKYLYQIIDFCDIGFIGYREYDLNFQLMAHASSQMVEFLRMGKPVIVFDNNDMGAFVMKHQLGQAIKSFDELDGALEAILADYGGYARRALERFEQEFCDRIYMDALLAWLAGEEASER